MNNNNRRKAEPVSDQELYKLPKDSIKDFIEKERRHDELDRLREVAEQKKTWNITIGFCLLLNLIFVSLAIYGWVTNGFT